MARAGAVLTLPKAEIELSTLAVLEMPGFAVGRQQKMLVRRFEARGWVLDLTHAQLPAAALTASRASPPREFSLLPAAYGDVVTAAPPPFRVRWK